MDAFYLSVLTHVRLSLVLVYLVEGPTGYQVLHLIRRQKVMWKAEVNLADLA